MLAIHITSEDKYVFIPVQTVQLHSTSD